LLGLAPADSSKYIPYLAVFACPIAAASGYYSTLHRLTSKQPWQCVNLSIGPIRR
jgi:hypothetical protein